MVAAVHLLVDSLRERGVRQTATRAQQLVAQRRARRRRAREDHAFDRERGIDTARWVHVPRLDTRSPNLRHAVRYQPTSVSEFRLLTAKLPADRERFVFVDYGAGKGRVLILAAELGFKRVVGVEFAGGLVETARANLERVGLGARVELVHGDAIAFEPPLEPLVLYFFNPFGPAVLRPVLARVRASLERAPRPAYVVLTGPTELAALVGEAGFEEVDVERGGWRERGIWRTPLTARAARP